ncbi:MAG: hypothetical protein AAF517_27330, partial [Planctomycetota bacterium]
MPNDSSGDTIYFACKCGKRFRMPLAAAGKVGTCPKCKARFSVPKAPSVEPSSREADQPGVTRPCATSTTNPEPAASGRSTPWIPTAAGLAVVGAVVTFLVVSSDPEGDPKAIDSTDQPKVASDQESTSRRVATTDLQRAIEHSDDTGDRTEDSGDRNEDPENRDDDVVAAETLNPTDDPTTNEESPLQRALRLLASFDPEIVTS